MIVPADPSKPVHPLVVWLDRHQLHILVAFTIVVTVGILVRARMLGG